MICSREREELGWLCRPCGGNRVEGRQGEAMVRDYGEVSMVPREGTKTNYLGSVEDRSERKQRPVEWGRFKAYF
jgi:hypothetical protein